MHTPSTIICRWRCFKKHQLICEGAHVHQRLRSVNPNDEGLWWLTRAHGSSWNMDLGAIFLVYEYRTSAAITIIANRLALDDAHWNSPCLLHNIDTKPFFTYCRWKKKSYNCTVHFNFITTAQTDKQKHREHSPAWNIMTNTYSCPCEAGQVARHEFYPL